MLKPIVVVRSACAPACVLDSDVVAEPGAIPKPAGCSLIVVGVCIARVERAAAGDPHHVRDAAHAPRPALRTRRRRARRDIDRDRHDKRPLRADHAGERARQRFAAQRRFALACRPFAVSNSYPSARARSSVKPAGSVSAIVTASPSLGAPPVFVTTTLYTSSPDSSPGAKFVGARDRGYRPLRSCGFGEGRGCH